MKRGFFITFEGGEGSGKSTQARRLVAALRRRGLRPVHTREPGGTAIAEAVRRVLLTPGDRVAPLTELLLYEAARAQHLAEIVRPALARGAVVVCERYTDATEAYQGFGRGLPLADIRLLNRIATGGLVPDLTFLLDVPVRRGLSTARRLGKKLARRAGRSRGGDRMERESPLFHERVRRGYLALARRDPRRVRLVPWGDPIETIHARVLSETDRRRRTRR